MTHNSNSEYQPATLAIHAGHEPDPSTGAVIPPISLSTTFKQSSVGVHKGYEYSRSDNPTRSQFEYCVANLEYAKYGLAFSSGSAATASIINMYPSDTHIISVNDVYGGTYRYFTRVASTKNIKVDFVDMNNVDNVEKYITDKTKLIWVETPTNPTLRLVDIKKLSILAKKHEIILVVDNTFLSPIFQNPILLGADIVVHSVTKYINGHSDVVMGIALTNDDKLYEELKFQQNAFGAVPSAFDCFLAHRGLKTLNVRMLEHQKNAFEICNYLQKLTPKYIDKIIYPGLDSHPQHALAKSQQKGFGGMVSFSINTTPDLASRFLSNLKIITLAESLGGIESLIEIPAKMTHAAVDQNERLKLGITDTLIRMSCGIEHYTDLINDLDSAFKSIFNDFN